VLDKLVFLKKSKLLSQAQFKSVFQKKNKRFAHYFIIYIVENKLDYPRIGFVLSKKQVKLATHRNTIRRVVKESFRMHQHSLPSLDFVIVGLTKADKVTKKELANCMAKQWNYFQSKYSSNLCEQV
jgi:ribonuclease P protein component